MGKASLQPGNIAVVGIQPTSTTKPTTSATGSTSSKTTTKSSGSSKSSGGSSSGSSKAAAAAAPAAPSYSSQFYSALAGGVPSSFNADEYIAQQKAADAARQIVETARASIQPVEVKPLDHIDIAEQRAQLQQITDQQKRQATQAIDYATQNGIRALNRNLADSAPLYQTQRNQADLDEAKALDNQVLYAEARGDRGGLGQAQYGVIQSAAAQNRANINSAEVKLRTDTARQITDLQAQGEFEKADKVLSIGTDYLTKLMDLEKWAKDKNVSIDEINSKLAQWQNEYNLDVSKYLTDTELNAAKMTGSFTNGTPTADYRNQLNDRYANSAKALISAGIVPSSAQLEAMGWTPEQYWIYQMAQNSY